MQPQTLPSVVLVVVVGTMLLLSAIPVSAQSSSTCSSTTDRNICADYTRATKTNLQCVWQNSKCSGDPCAQYTTNETCRADAGCISTEWVTGSGAVTCMSFELLCTKLPPGAPCDQSGLCRTDGVNCVWALPTGTGAPGENKDPQCLNFPTWSIALIVLWVVLMCVLVFIILILKKKKHADAIKGVEQENEVVVDSLHIDDAFRPQSTVSHMQPLVTNQIR